MIAVAISKNAEETIKMSKITFNVDSGLRYEDVQGSVMVNLWVPDWAEAMNIRSRSFRTDARFYISMLEKRVRDFEETERKQKREQDATAIGEGDAYFLVNNEIMNE